MPSSWLKAARYSRNWRKVWVPGWAASSALPSIWVETKGRRSATSIGLRAMTYRDFTSESELWPACSSSRRESWAGPPNPAGERRGGADGGGSCAESPSPDTRGRRASVQNWAGVGGARRGGGGAQLPGARRAVTPG